MEYLKKEIQKHKSTLNELNNLLIDEKNKQDILRKIMKLEVSQLFQLKLFQPKKDR